MKQPCILQLPTHYHHLHFLPGANSAVVQQHQHNEKGHRHQLNHPRQKPRDLNKGMVFTRFMIGHCIRRWGGGDTDVYLRDPCAFLWGKLGGTDGLLCCIGPCRHSQSKYCETLHNATRDSQKQAWPQNGALGVVEENVHQCYFGFSGGHNMGRQRETGLQFMSVFKL